MIGAIAGDIVGSAFERRPIKTTEFDLINFGCRFTDDTVLIIAVADAILKKIPYQKSIRHWGLKYPTAGYGQSFDKWLYSSDPKPYNSWGNGSAMRVIPIGYAFHKLEDVLLEAKRTAEITHDHPEGIKGAQAVATTVFLARTGSSKDEIRQYITTTFGYDLDRSIEEIRPDYKFEISCQRSVPESIISFLDSTDYETAIKLAVSLGGDSDTQACIAGGIAEAFYKEIPEYLIRPTKEILPKEILEVIEEFKIYRNK